MILSEFIHGFEPNALKQLHKASAQPNFLYKLDQLKHTIVPITKIGSRKNKRQKSIISKSTTYIHRKIFEQICMTLSITITKKSCG